MAIFASQAQNFDPEPWLFISDQVFGDFRSAVDKGYHDVSGTYYAYSPRPEYGNRVNPILADYRVDCEYTTWGSRNPLDWMQEAANPDTWPGVVFPFSDDEMNHARKVLKKLAALA
jgi:hypothetical protein